MNHIFQLIWNPASQSYCPAPETARNKRKGGGRRLALALAVATATSGAYAGPSGGTVIDGNANIDVRGKLTEILQNSQNTTIVWDSFNIKADEIVNFLQPNETSIALNRVFSADGTTINGQLNANGRVFVLDANGVLFGQDASVNVGSLVASSLDVSHNDYGHFTFSGNGKPAAVTNLGNISVADSGAVALLGGQVSNRGVIQAKLGNVALAAGNKITLDFAGDGLLNVQVDEAALNALAENHGLIQTPGGQVLMTAHASDALLQTVVNNSGVIEAQSLQQQDGKIMLLGGFNGGTVNVSGTLVASAPNDGNGGFVETSGAVVKVTSQARVNTSAANGDAGTWLVDPTDLEVSYNELGANNGVSHMHTQALQNSLAGGNVVLQTANSGSGAGDITIVDPIIWDGAGDLTLEAHGGITFNDYIHAPSGGLTLNAGSNISSGAEGHIRVGSFTLEGGDFSQINANLPVFNADDFTLNGGTFIRATGGNGTGSALQISDAFGLQGLATTPTLNAQLVNDIDASGTSGWNGGEGFSPIGDDSNGYSATFDGAGFVIDKLSINRPTEDNVALFGATSATAAIGQLGVTQSNITGGDVVGSLVGDNQGEITQSYSTASVTGNDAIGGLVGSNQGEITQSYTTGGVSGNDAVGGLVGANQGEISQSYATGAVTGVTDTGGLVGINNSVVTDSYWDGHTTGMTASGVGNNTGTFTATEVNGDWNATPDAYNEATYADLDFSNGWFIAEGSSRPMLRGFLDGGNISNLYQLQGMAADLAGDYTLTQNIDASATASTDNADVWGGRGFAPVGVIGDEFTGSLNGGGFAITDLTINRADQMLVGLFGHMSGSITQLTFVNADITGNDMVGVLAGGTDGGSVDTVSVSGVINGQGAVGALVGINAGSIAKSYSTATVNGSQHVGGLVGINLLGVIEDSFATGAVTVTGANAGGLVGLNIGEINTSYASGLVTGTAGTQGGLIGENDAIGTVTNSAFDAFTSGQTDAIGADANAQTVSALSGDWANSPDAYNASSYTGFNFANTWFIADGSSRPMLRSFLSGSGEVHNLYDLQGMAADLTGSYTLMAGIDASDTASIDNADIWGGRGFAPVGNVTTAFNGSLNGNGFMINDLTINRADQNYVGLIGNAGAGSNLSNLKLFANVVGADQTGLLAGANAGIISNALIGGEVIGNNAVGGVVGLNEGTINTSMHVGFFSGQVKVDTRVSGVGGGYSAVNKKG